MPCDRFFQCPLSGLSIQLDLYNVHTILSSTYSSLIIVLGQLPSFQCPLRGLCVLFQVCRLSTLTNVLCSLSTSDRSNCCPLSGPSIVHWQVNAWSGFFPVNFSHSKIHWSGQNSACQSFILAFWSPLQVTFCLVWCCLPGISSSVPVLISILMSDVASPNKIINQSINQLINQSVSQWVNQSINQPTFICHNYFNNK